MEHLIERIYNFLLEYVDEKGDLLYLNAIDEMIIEEKRSLYVDLKHLENFDPVVVDELLITPKIGIKSAIDSLKQVLLGKEPEYLSRMQNRVYLRFFNPPDRIKKPLRKIRSYALGTLTATEAIITKSTEVKPYLETATFRCARCQALQPAIKFTEGEYNPPFTCINSTNQTDPCTNKTFTLVKDQSTFIDFQRVSLQEKPEELPSGQMPESLTMFMRDDLCDQVRPGDRVKIVGILESRTDGQLSRGKMPLFMKYLECVAIEKESEEYTDIEISEDDEREIVELSKDPNVHRRIRNSIAPIIFGALEEKEAISYLLFGGTSKETKDGTKIRGESNILLIGDPGVGKSQILKSVSDLVPRGLYTSGRGSSAAGLTASVLRDPETGEMTLEAGGVVLADKGVCFIDEFDKMRREDRSALHEAIEHHSYHPNFPFSLF
jgi:replicative DNA helicase Mcm